MTVCVFGPVPHSFDVALGRLRVRIVRHKTAPSNLRWGLKWLALRDVAAMDDVLFVDADTVFLGPAEEFFEHSSREFYAVEEMGTRLNQPGVDGVERNLHVSRRRLNAFRLRHELAAGPIFNSSLMLFNRGAHRKMIDRLPLILGFMQEILDHPKNSVLRPKWLFMAEEVAGSLALQVDPKLTHGFWNARAVTHYNRWIRGGRGPLGSFLHIGSEYVGQFLEETGSTEQFKTWKRLYLRERGTLPAKLTRISVAL